MKENATFSVRLVTVDYYLNPPIPGLDVTRSEFRGSEVKQVPILRIFGPTSNGEKTCMHIHGVFPYLYIPCEDSNPEPKQAYQIAKSIDKAINISLKQSNSTNQHIYKVILVKGIPFYGFHSRHHQFYKIFFYNPLFIKRTADLLQSGAIMGVSYQPHEAHLNFVMQFFIDFNLYGMSFINVKHVKFRRKDSSLEQSTIDSNYLLHSLDNLECISTCQIELDCLAINIMNREEILNGNSGVNPGLEALWDDEKKRHEYLNMSHEITPTPSQIRDNVPVTESHDYFDKKLRVKLIINSEILDKSDLDSTMTLTENMGNDICENSTLNTSIYPAETPDQGSELNATSVFTHHPLLDFQKVENDQKNLESNLETLVDEDIVIRHSQNDTDDVNLDSDDLNLMSLLKGMENNTDEDSILGSQVKENDTDLHQEDVFNKTNSELFSKDYDLNDTQSFLNPLSSLPSSWNDSYWESVENISQLDGTWDDKIEKKRTKRSLRLGLSKPSKKRKMLPLVESEKMLSVATPKKERLNIEDKFKVFGVTPIKTPVKSPKRSPKKSPRNFEPLQRTIQKTSSAPEISAGSHLNICTTPTKLDSKQICEVNSNFKNLRNRTSKVRVQLNYECKKVENAHSEKSQYRERDQSKSDKVSFDNLSNLILSRHDINQEVVLDNTITDEKLYSCDLEETIKEKNHKSTNLTASQYDRFNNYQPQPGPSKTLSDEQINSTLSSSILDDSQQNQHNIISFYNTTLYNDSNVIFNVNDSSPDPLKVSQLNLDISKKHDSFNDFKLCLNESSHDILKNLHSYGNLKTIAQFQSRNSFNKIVLIPKCSPPSFNDILSTLQDFKISAYKHPSPFYSNYKDVGAQIEIGQIILKLKSNQINDLKEFSSDLADTDSLIVQRKNIFMQSNMSQPSLDLNNLDTILASNKPYVLTPVIKPPSFKSVKEWLNTQRSKKSKPITKDEHSCEKIMFLVPNSPDRDLDNSQVEILSVSSCSQSSVSTDNQTQEVKSQSDELCVNLRSSQNSYSENKFSQKSSDSDEITCGQKVKEDLDFIECSQKVVIDDLEKVHEDIRKNSQICQSIINQCSEGLMSTTNAYKFSGDNYQNADVYHENDYLTLLSLEILTSTRGDLNPDPQHDPICAVFYSILNDCPVNHKMRQRETGFIILDCDSININKFLTGFPSDYKIIVVNSEKNVLEELVNIILNWDPDILCGYEIEMCSWGYVFQRSFALGINLPCKVSRVSMENKFNFRNTDSQDDINKEIRLVGRIVLNVWRLLRHEVALVSYSFESVMYHVLHERVPMFSYKTLSFWWNHPSKLLKSLCVEYYLTRVMGTIRILLQLDLIGRTSELAKLFGIQWYEVLSRGSQFRVESMMIRLTRTRNYVLVSPSVQQRAAMKAPECLPLILEPESRFYTDPVIVLDFQSLYPSMMIAYNYCFSTCIGKIENIGKNIPFQFGASLLRISPKILKKLNEQDLINWSPCGVGFVKSSVRKGILPIMLQGILGTRFMVKKAMKKYKDKTLQKILHNRQLGLKLIANVTYGYTAANFSGRMPCVEVGDSVVAKGRETLERAIKIVESTPKWNAKVVYGDTDSIFVLVPGRSRSEAFDIGAEIAETITNDNPTPVKLKLEKIYQPCILQTKKRYVGYKYESKDQKSPEYEAKGIETVRRDGCPAASKILEKSLKILFDTYDVSKVKLYVFKKFQNIIEGKCNIQDFIFAREFRGMNAYKQSASIPALEIAKRLKLTDHRKEPREGQRVPYVIINGAPGETLLSSARCPRELLQNPSLRLNSIYYITRAIIPPLNRCFTLLGADVNLWFAEMPRRQLQFYPILNDSGKWNDNKKNTISQYFSKVNCVGCNEQTTQGICQNCINNPQETTIKLYNKINNWQRNYALMRKICQSCCGRSTQIDCISIDCPNLFHLNSLKQDVQQIPFVEEMKKKIIIF